MAKRTDARLARRRRRRRLVCLLLLSVALYFQARFHPSERRFDREGGAILKEWLRHPREFQRQLGMTVLTF